MFSSFAAIWSGLGAFYPSLDLHSSALLLHYQFNWVYPQKVSESEVIEFYTKLMRVLTERYETRSWIDENDYELNSLVSRGYSILPLLVEDLKSSNQNFWVLIYLLREVLKDGPTIPESAQGKKASLHKLWLAWLCSDHRTKALF